MMSSVHEEINKEIIRRVEIIESPDYEFVSVMTRADKIAITILSVVLTVSMIIVYNTLV